MSETSYGTLQRGEASALLKIFNHLVLFGLRGVSTGAKFILALYTARYLGLAELGVYGLVVAAGTLSPAWLGFGLTEWVARRIVLATPEDALRKIAARFTITVWAHIVFQPIFWAGNFALGSPVPTAWAWFIAPIALLEHLSSDAHDLFIARGCIALTSTLEFIRAGLWPVVIVGLGLLYPETRTLDSIFLGWLLGLTLTWTVLLSWMLAQRAGPLLCWTELSEQLSSLRGSCQLYLRNVTDAASLFIDRYLISLTLGLELTGVYVFFWSVANVVHGMIIAVIVQPQATRLIEAAAKADAGQLHDRERKLRLEAASWTLLMSIAAFGAVFALLPFLQRPTLDAYLPLFGLLLLATWARIGADQYGYLLLALHRDRAILIAGAVGALASATLNVILVPMIGLWGAAAAFLLTGVTVVALECSMSRHPLPGRVTVRE
ncbi:MAG: hypothetical protein QOD94_450 [Alphaproteobacteria bacterium]|jgi:O-antigen/teichoic acid export membrane protein|nr:hypothetical protein [Alphaproteobacteria bacterium]